MTLPSVPSATPGLTTINGLPAHVLIVHAVAVLVPLSILCLLIALKPSIARRFGLALPVLTIATLLSVFAAMNAGGWLQNHVDNTPLVRAHTAIAGQLWPFVAGLAVLSLVVWRLYGRRTVPSAGPSSSMVSRRTTATVAVLVVLVCAGSLVQVVRIGESGSRAAWTDHFSQTAIGNH